MNQAVSQLRKEENISHLMPKKIVSFSFVSHFDYILSLFFGNIPHYRFLTVVLTQSESQESAQDYEGERPSLSGEV